MVKIGSLWIRQGKNGEFFAGKFGDASIMIFPVKNKTKAEQPDYEIVIAENKQRPGVETPRGAVVKPKSAITPRPQTTANAGPAWDPEDPGPEYPSF